MCNYLIIIHCSLTTTTAGRTNQNMSQETNAVRMFRCNILHPMWDLSHLQQQQHQQQPPPFFQRQMLVLTRRTFCNYRIFHLRGIHKYWQLMTRRIFWHPLLRQGTYSKHCQLLDSTRRIPHPRHRRRLLLLQLVVFCPVLDATQQNPPPTTNLFSQVT